MSPHCTPETCANHGVCRNNPHLQQPCDCDLTSFTGPRCSDGKLSYHLPNIKDTSPLQGIFSSDGLFPLYYIFSWEFASLIFVGQTNIICRKLDFIAPLIITICLIFRLRFLSKYEICQLYHFSSIFISHLHNEKRTRNIYLCSTPFQ